MKCSVLVLLAFASSGVFAQRGVGAPPDVPKNHWAFKAVDEMFQLGLLDGYPDGSFKGDPPASRNELAGALHKTSLKAAGQLKPAKVLLR